MPRFYLPLRVFQHQYFPVPLHSYTLLNNNMGADLGENPPYFHAKRRIFGRIWLQR